MATKILDGRACGKAIKATVATAIKKRQQMGLAQPGLDVILVGDNPASAAYVHHKQSACKEVGIRSRIHHLPTDVSHTRLEQLITTCNSDNSVHGILLQLPLPEQLTPDNLLECINPRKD